MPRTEIPDVVYDAAFDACPVCGSRSLLHGALTSTAGFMSQPNVDHSRCNDCGSYFVNPQPSAASLEQFYSSQAVEDLVQDKILSRSLDRYFDPHLRDYFVEHRVTPLRQYLRPGGSLLDVGCGVGVFVRVMQDLGYRAHGTDVSVRSVSVGRDRLGLGEALSVSDWSESMSGVYDAITAWTLIEHLKNPAGFLNKASAAVAPGGILLVECPTVDSLLFRHLKSSFFWVMPYYHLFLFSRGGMRAMLAGHGFDLLQEYDMPRNWYFVASVCRSLGLDVDALATGKWPDVVKRIDEIFDDIAREQGLSSTVQFIARRR